MEEKLVLTVDTNKISFFFNNSRVTANVSTENYIIAKNKIEFWEGKKYEQTESWLYDLLFTSIVKDNHVSIKFG